MRYYEIEPPENLRNFVQCFWAFEIGPDKSPQVFSVVPDCSVNITYVRTPHFSGLRISGPTLKATDYSISPGHFYWGLRFQPYAGPLALNLGIKEILEKKEDLFAVAPKFAGKCKEPLDSCPSGTAASEVFFAVVQESLDPKVSLDPRLLRGVGRLIQDSGNVSIEAVAREAGMSERQFQRTFRQHLGVTPKQFARIRRLRAAIWSLRSENVQGADLAAVKGYNDQAHFSNECKGIMRSSPTQINRQHHKVEYGNVLD